MPFTTAKQEVAMMINAPKVWGEWVKKYGHHSKFKELLKQSKRKTGNKKKSKRKKKNKRKSTTRTKKKL